MFLLILLEALSGDDNGICIATPTSNSTEITDFASSTLNLPGEDLTKFSDSYCQYSDWKEEQTSDVRYKKVNIIHRIK